MTKKLISVIDDDEGIRRSTVFLIESFGFRAVGFESAEKFLQADAHTDSSCLIVDIEMPGMSGLELQNELAAAGCHIPIIFVTAYDDNASRKKAMQAGAVAFLGKPFNDEELLRAIRLALRVESEAIGGMISVVDDDESVRHSTKLLIESIGFRAAAFESAETFLKSDQLHDTACLILDIRMPGMNGIELQRELASAGYSIPIVFITSYDDKEARRRAMQAGAVAFLGKPFRDEQLLRIVRTALQLNDESTKPGG